jgi:glycerophosphoryl diester phosphodiesterase
MDRNRIILAAHRGDKKNYPENTMPAFVAAYEAGVDMIETDIHMTKDGELIIMHDRSALRTAGVDRYVTDMTLSEVQELDAGAFFSEEFRGTKVPTVREFIEWIRDTNLFINWELKDYPNSVGEALAFEAADRLIALVEEYGLGDRSMFNSFSDRVLEHIYLQYGHRYPIHGQGIHRAKKTCDTAETPEEEIFTWCCLYSEEKGKLPIDFPENFIHCTECGIKPCVCLADTEEIYRRSIELGCRMFTSNDIHEAKRILTLLGER